MRARVSGMFPDTTVKTNDGIIHQCITLEWGRNEAQTTYAVLCDFERTGWLIGSVNVETLRGLGVRFSAIPLRVSSTCMACLAQVDDWHRMRLGVLDLST